MKKLQTIKLQGKDYIQVHTRVEAFHEQYKNGSITPRATFIDDTVYFRATVTPDVENPTRKFVGHSLGKFGKEKALEKLETVAVGRALAFMGIGLQQGIASADEMQDFKKRKENMMGPATGAKLGLLLKIIKVDVEKYEAMINKKIVDLTAKDAVEIIKNLEAKLTPEQKAEYEDRAF